MKIYAYGLLMLHYSIKNEAQTNYVVLVTTRHCI